LWLDTPDDRLHLLPANKIPTAASAAPAREAPRAGILHATLEELARSDFGALTFERVAQRAGVNKTTLYRNWSSKADLVRAALAEMHAWINPGPTSGSVRKDLIRVGRLYAEFATSFDGQCLIRLRLINHPEPELAMIARDLHAKRTARLTSLVQAGIDRGEIAPSTDARLLLDMLSGTLHLRIVMRNEAVDDVVISRVVDTLLAGVKAPKPSRGVPRRKTPRRRRT
jgi:AcrR family transcriptional regulator